jgi:hypothetical protein
MVIAHIPEYSWVPWNADISIKVVNHYHFLWSVCKVHQTTIGAEGERIGNRDAVEENAVLAALLNAEHASGWKPIAIIHATDPESTLPIALAII